VYKKNILLIILIGVISFILYVPSLSFNFINWDDDIHVYNNPSFETQNPLKTIWITFKTHSYLPIAHTFFYLQWKISHSPRLFHTINIILHTINILLIFIVLQKLQLDTVSAFFITIIYVIHPMRAETVAWISDQKAIISGIFVWLAFLSYLKYSTKNTKFFLFLTALLYTFAMLSKQTAFPIIFVFLCYKYFILENKKIKNYLPEIITLCSVGIGIMYIHLARESQHFFSTMASSLPFFTRILVFFKSFVYYPLKTIIPIEFCPIYPSWNFFQDFVGDFLPIIAVLFLTSIILYQYKKNNTIFSKWLIFGYMSYILTIFPVTGIFTMPYLNTSFIADRYSYFSGLFIIIIVVLTVKNYFKKYAYSILSIFAIACAISTYYYLPIWKDSNTFWNYVIKHNPYCDAAYINLSYNYLHKENITQEDIQNALHLSEKAIQLNSNNALGYYNYGVCFMKLGDIESAKKFFVKALELKPDYSDIWNDLGFLYELETNTEEALKCYNKALEYNPEHKVAKFNTNRLSNNTN